MADQLMTWLARIVVVAGVLYLVTSVAAFVAIGDPFLLIHSAFGTVAAAYAAHKLGSSKEPVEVPVSEERFLSAAA